MAKSMALTWGSNGASEIGAWALRTFDAERAGVEVQRGLANLVIGNLMAGRMRKF